MVEHFISAFKQKVEEIRLVGGQIDNHRLLKVLVRCVPSSMAQNIIRATDSGEPDIAAVLDEIRKGSTLLDRETWTSGNGHHARQPQS